MSLGQSFYKQHTENTDLKCKDCKNWLSYHQPLVKCDDSYMSGRESGTSEERRAMLTAEKETGIGGYMQDDFKSIGKECSKTDNHIRYRQDTFLGALEMKSSKWSEHI